jgi:two-component system phosphate regulon response regulator PhoB
MALIVAADDDADVLELIAMTLRGGGHEVVTTVSAPDALMAIQTRRPDLLVTDFQMPGMTGVELAQRLRSDDATAAIPIILLTAVGKYKDLHTVDRWLDKPFSPARLRAHVDTLLSRTAR